MVEVIKFWRHAQPNSAMSDPIIWNLRIFSLYILALPRFSPQALQHFTLYFSPGSPPPQAQASSGGAKGRAERTAQKFKRSVWKLVVRIWKIKGKETPNVWNIRLFQSFNFPEI